MANPQKDKGKRFEREVAQYFTETFNKPFQRVPNSGAFTGGKNQNRLKALSNTQIKLHRGDIIAPDEYNIVIECKNYHKKNFTGGFVGLMQSYSSKFEDWLDEVRADADNTRIPYILAFKITGASTHIFFALPEAHFKLKLKDSVYTRYYYAEAKEYYIIVNDMVFKGLKGQVERYIKI